MKFSKKFGLDLGTSNTLIWESENGLLLNQPTVVAVGLEDRRVLAVGEEARSMLGKTPEYVEVVKPMSGGVISDYEVSEAMLSCFFKSVMGRNWFMGPEVMICVPASVTQVEQRAVLDAVLAAGARRAYLIDGPLTAAIGAKIPVVESCGNMIVNFGGGVTEAAVIALGGVVSCRGLRNGGEVLNQTIGDYIRKKHNLILGELTLESIKIKLGSAIKLKKAEELEVNGRDLLYGLPKSLVITSDEIYEAIKPALDSFTEVIRASMEITPPELVADIMDRGIVLCGAGAQLRNLNVLVMREIGVSAHLAPDPFSCSVRGAAIVLDNLESYKRALK